MNVLKLTLAAATLTIGLAASASALPVDKLGTIKVDGVQVDQVRLVCNRYGRCWRTGGYRVYGYGHRHYGYRHYGYRHYGYRRW